MSICTNFITHNIVCDGFRNKDLFWVKLHSFKLPSLTFLIKRPGKLVSERSIHFLLNDRLMTEERTVFGCTTYMQQNLWIWIQI
jgi:hypothetical protein